MNKAILAFCELEGFCVGKLNIKQIRARKSVPLFVWCEKRDLGTLLCAYVLFYSKVSSAQSVPILANWRGSASVSST